MTAPNIFGPRPTHPSDLSAAGIAAFANARNQWDAQQRSSSGTGTSGQGAAHVYSGNPGDYQGFYADPDWFTRNGPNKVFAGQTLSPEYQQGQGQQNAAYGMYQHALQNPGATADLFGKYFQSAADAYTRPAMQQFNQQLAGVQGNIASRFGGQASSEEGRGVYNTSNLFSQNLTNALAGLAPQQVAAGANYTNQLGNAYALQSQNQMALRNAILSGLSPGANTAYQPQASPLGSILGTIGGALIGGPAGAAVGGSLGGGTSGLAQGTTIPGVGLYNGYTGGP